MMRKIKQLRSEAEASGNVRLVERCDLAIRGNRRAFDELSRFISECDDD
jgi:hypothetical protein